MVSKSVTPNLILGASRWSWWGNKKKRSRGTQLLSVCTSACLLKCRTVVNYFFGISSRYTCIFIPICTSSYSSICPCVFYSGLPRRRLNQSQTGPLFILGDCNCLQPPGKCSPAVRDHNRLHMHLHTPSILPSSSCKVNQSACRSSENNCANLRTSSTGLLL